MEKFDDGGLNFLNIPRDPSSRSFNCDVTTKQKLINTCFYVIDIIDGVKTKHGGDRMIVKIKRSLDDADSKAEKFFTNSSNIKYVLNKVKELDKFPRKVTMRVNGNNYFLE